MHKTSHFLCMRIVQKWTTECINKALERFGIYLSPSRRVYMDSHKPAGTFLYYCCPCHLYNFANPSKSTPKKVWNRVPPEPGSEAVACFWTEMVLKSCVSFICTNGRPGVYSVWIVCWVCGGFARWYMPKMAHLALFWKYGPCITIFIVVVFLTKHLPKKAGIQCILLVVPTSTGLWPNNRGFFYRLFFFLQMNELHSGLARPVQVVHPAGLTYVRSADGRKGICDIYFG